MLEKAKTLRPDVVILDLEDGVAIGEKDAARRMVAEALDGGGFQARVCVRINAFSTGLTEADLVATVKAPVETVLLPKVEVAADIERVATLLGELEADTGRPAGSTRVLAMVETALGVLNALYIARASERMSALCFGAEDFSRDIGAIRTKEGEEVAHARAQMLLAARATGMVAVDTPFTDISDDEGFLAETRRMRAMGYSGKLLIHPRQIDLTHQAFAPTEAEIAHARRVVEAFDQAQAEGTGAIALDGQMIDAPVVARAREILSHAESY